MAGKKNKNPLRKALTLLEMVIALAMMVIIIAVFAPQLKMINDSWASKQANAEVLQNARVAIDQINRSLSSADRITDVSELTETNGYIEFEDNTGTGYRIDIAANNYIEYGPVGSLSELAGPVSQLKITCYNGDDLDTPLNISVDGVEGIRFVKVDVIFPNPGSGQDKQLVASAYLRTNFTIERDDDDPYVEGSNYEFDTGYGDYPALSKIDESHFLCAYAGVGDDGFAVVLTVDVDNETITKGVPTEFDTLNGQYPALCRIDESSTSTAHLCAYTGIGGAGTAVVLEIEDADWTVTSKTPFVFDSQDGLGPALAKIDDSHYLCAYAGFKDQATAVILNVKTNSKITMGTPFLYDSGKGGWPALLKIDATHYLCAYDGDGGTGKAVILIPDTVSQTITKAANFIFDLNGGSWPALSHIAGYNYLCAYTLSSNYGYSSILRVNPVTWRISTVGTGFAFGPGQGKWPALARINNTEALIAWDGVGDSGTAAFLSVNKITWEITKKRECEFDLKGMAPALHQIKDGHYIGVYQGKGNTGFAVLFDTGIPIRP